MLSYTHQMPLLVLYGSQTGNAQDVAERIAREACRRHFRPRVMPCDAYMPLVAQLPSEAAIVFVLSTTGQGENPDNMKSLWRFLLRKSLPPNSLADVVTAVFGLGDSGYPKYNVVSKKLYRRLEGLGAQMVLPLGQGDDQHRSGYEAALDPWLIQLWASLRSRFPLPAGLSEPPPSDTFTELIPKYSISFLPPEEWPTAGQITGPQTNPTPPSHHAQELAAARAFNQVEAEASGLPHPAAGEGQAVPSTAQAANGSHSSCVDPRGSAAPATTSSGGTSQHREQYGPNRPYFARLAVNQRITAQDHFQDVRHLEFELGEDGPEFQPGDVLALVPRQPDSVVDRFLKRCGLDPEGWVRVEPAQQQTSVRQEEGATLPTASATVQIGPLVAGALDINGASPRRFFFQVLRHFTRCEVEAERLDYFASAEGRDDLYAYNQREGRTVAEVLADFKSATLPLEWLLQTVPRLKPRLFSIASSPQLHPRAIHLTVAIVDWVTPYKRKRRGVCTSWLAGLDPTASQGESLLPVWVQRGALQMPANPSTPLILVGPGTGVAPLRSFLQHRQAWVRAGPPPRPSPCMLFFGCRNAAGDFLYRQEWERMQQEGVLADPGGLVTAFSRDQASKVYVQHRIRERAEHVWNWLSQEGAVIYVAGSADKMPAQVASAFEDVACTAGGLTREAAQKWVRQLEATARYQVEAWS